MYKIQKLNPDFLVKMGNFFDLDVEWESEYFVQQEKTILKFRVYDRDHSKLQVQFTLEKVRK